MPQVNVDIESSLLATMRSVGQVAGMTQKETVEQALMLYFAAAEGRAQDPDGETVTLPHDYYLDLHDPIMRERLLGCDLRLHYFAALESLLRQGLDTATRDDCVEIPLDRVRAVLASNPSTEVERPKRRRGLGPLSTFISVVALVCCPVNLGVGCHGSTFNVREPKVKLARTQNWGGKGRKLR